MKLQNEFEVAMPLKQVWPALLDIQSVAQLLPGAKLEPTDEPGLYRGAMTVKLGPMTTSYRGTATLGVVDEEAHSAAIEVEATETRGQGRAAATIRNTLVEVEGRTRVVVETELRITGRQAQFGRGVLQDVATSMLNDFSSRFEASLSPVESDSSGEEGEATRAAAPAPEEVLDLGVLATNAVRRPLAAAAAAATAALIFIAWRILRRDP